MGEKTAPEKKPVADRPRVLHLLVLPDRGQLDGQAFTDFEPFTAEIDARRALDDRPDWKYLALTPGASYQARKGQRS